MNATSCLLVVLALTIPSEVIVNEPFLTSHDLARLDADQLDALFAMGSASKWPVGFVRGRILLRVDGKMPRVRAGLQGLAWKGKVFQDDGTFINQWVGFRAIASRIEIGPSWRDERPRLVLTYSPGTPIFGNDRDELREIAPGMWLGRIYAICPSRKLKGCFVLEILCEK